MRCIAYVFCLVLKQNSLGQKVQLVSSSFLSGLPTGLLQEHGTPFTRLSAFNGDPDSTTVSTPLRCRLVQATLLSATVNANAQVDTAALPAESGSDTFGYQTLL